MRRFITLILIAIVTLSILFAWYNPDKLEDIWLWIVGLAGTVIGYVRELIKWFKSQFKNIESYVQEKFTSK